MTEKNARESITLPPAAYKLYVNIKTKCSVVVYISVKEMALDS
jgi:hypothetical protein